MKISTPSTRSRERLSLMKEAECMPFDTTQRHPMKLTDSELVGPYSGSSRAFDDSITPKAKSSGRSRF